MSTVFDLDISPDFRLEVDVAMSLCETVDSPRSLAVFLLLKHCEFDQYLDLTIEPHHYENPSNFADDYLVTEVLRKSPLLPVSHNRKEAALESFWTSELGCWATNLRIREQTFEFEHVFRKRIAHILGPLDRTALEFIEDNMRHGPGATASLRSRGLVVSDKFEKPLSATVELIPFYKSILGPLWHSCQTKPVEIVEGNKFTTVPKNAKTDRGIAAEPTLNMYVQLGIGKYMRKRLRKFGLDLQYQGRNAELAGRAYSEGLATIDLSNASDSVARDLILSYFPEDWVELLTLVRSHRTCIDGSWHELEKFSSMGNGYTFELESLIFFALCTSVVPQSEWDKVGVYGDDIILPAVYSGPLIKALRFLGFSVNQRKSFLAGSFFESCGADYFRGVEVRPFYLKGNKKPLEGGGVTPYSVRILNRLRLYSCKRLGGQFCDSRFRPLWVRLYNTLPREWKRVKVPPSFGDLGVISSIIEAKPKRPRDQTEGYRFYSMAFKVRKKDKRNIFVLISNLAQGGSPENASLGREPRRGYLGKPFPKKAFVSHWPDGLAWLT